MNKIAISILLLSLISCSSNDDDQDLSNKASIIGEWYIEKAEIYRSLNQQIQTSFSTDCEKKSTYEFTATHLLSIIYAQNSNTCVKTDTGAKRYTFDKGNGKFWFENEESYPYFVTKLSDTDMVVEDRSQDLDGDGTKDILRRFYKRIN